MKNPLQGANTQMADPNEEPTVPQAAATVLLVRDCLLYTSDAADE